MTARRRVLISGASIAGPTLAFWMDRAGWDVTVIERAPELRTGGQNIDIRGAGREVARRMGVEEAIRARNTHEVGTRFIGGRGQTVASFPAGRDDTGGATAELEILRGELSRVLFDLIADRVVFRFGTTIRSLDDRATDSQVGFDDGSDELFDLVVIAEGMRSRTRRLVFPGIDPIVSKNMSTAYLTIPRTPDDTDWWRWYSAVGGRSVTLRPDNLGTIRATLSYPTRGDERTDTGDDTAGDVRAGLRERFADAGWEASRVLREMTDTDELYLDRVGQVHLDTWHRGRVALVGDAAYCASPLSGMGTTLSLVGAYVLAGELGRSNDVDTALQRYEDVLRPFVERAQDLPPGTPRLANPRSRAGIAIFHGVLRAAASRAGRRVTAGLFRPPADTFELPDYE
ncbi:MULTISPECIES: FAD-dependent monooxygenase [Microbacterium]|jgi:2-polyprenyl-6-methoxyphenol hydroxylase-like FAD-dependent oxidoreductase|uniref:FAD-dependent monooxygenase n=1 Tax=Microbacterium TaxID=33882 RepID=UPI0027874A7D|nr:MULTISPECIES: FAD-dependent monooxygenase [Microbacterium]MDF2918227.1 2-polyprenyl-6-methoxyphenol hydroxylase-like oxidoreductase [Microbacterium sp.]MDQ1075826.1 2-polyprenyl-6-methoxyphenol hydroxylase-like FAD-dependent oxidoreductase [Microbacterium sp. SORGH_AS_0969]MDQ1116070.1 2-polyprenyl-6-methoxyphenol hydroxylase-like FAD-dependent oxidoreductase [Microbacterium testaceum]